MRSTTITTVVLSAFVGQAFAQSVGTLTAETHPSLSVSTCTKSGGCTTKSASIVVDSNWRWTHYAGNSTNCYTGNLWDTNACPDPTTCTNNCVIEGADYSGSYGVTTSGNALNMKFITTSQYSTNVGTRVYLLDTETSYQILKLKNKEFTFDVDVSGLGCGLNGALYLVEMAADGGLSKYSTNKAGAKYGTGYCDAQCPHDLKWINGEANVLDWTPSSNDANAGTGRYGSCCSEMDIWEANKVSNAFTPHPCSTTGQTRCSGTDCGDGSERYSGLCDKDGCDYNPYRMNVKSFYGEGLTIDTTKPFTVVTQFITSDNTDTGDLVDIKRFYVQSSTVNVTPKANWTGLTSYDSVSDSFCSAQKTLFGDTNHFATKGGIKAMGDAMGRGMVLTMSVWDDHTSNMLWLDSNFPADGDPSTPGVARGTCPTTSGVPADVESQQTNAYVKYSNIKWGEFGSTTGYNPYNAGGSSSSSSSSSASRTTTTTTTTTTSRAASTTTTSSSRTTTTTTSSSRTTTTTTSSSRTTTTTTSSRTTTTTTTSASPSPTGSCSAKWSQCAGLTWSGPFCCQSGLTCTYFNDWYSQCL